MLKKTAIFSERGWCPPPREVAKQDTDHLNSLFQSMGNRRYIRCCSDINLLAILCGFSKSINTIRMAAWRGGLQGYRDWEGWRQSIGRGDTLPLQCTSQCARQNQHEASFSMIFLCRTFKGVLLSKITNLYCLTWSAQCTFIASNNFFS